nr:MAG TPA_asm: hypothetical protein [Bacteriophage sp.]DAW41706.1 MAG TPA: hypothetical protein [Caudoviricetes sp.]DAX95324.1 MAG TPA: hypothetical protein [Caudoviricetes sp.]
MNHKRERLAPEVGGIRPLALSLFAHFPTPGR